MIKKKNILRKDFRNNPIQIKRKKLVKNKKNLSKEFFTTEIINPKIKTEGVLISVIYFIYLIILFFINPADVMMWSNNLKNEMDYYSESHVLNMNLQAISVLIIDIPIAIIGMLPFLLPVIYLFFRKKDNQQSDVKKEGERRIIIKFLIWLKWFALIIIALFLYVLLGVFFAILAMIIEITKDNIIIFFGILLISICLYFKNYVVKCLLPIFIIFFILINSINKEASGYILLVFLSFISTLLINSVKYRLFNIVRIDLNTMHFIIKERIDMLNEIMKIKNKSIIKEVAILALLVTSGNFFFTNNTMMISDNVLMQKIINEPMRNDCEKGVYFIPNKEISHNATINNVLKYAIFNDLINFNYKKNSILDGYKKDKYVIKEYNIPDYYVSLTPIIYTIGIITSIDNAQTKNYTHNNIITEYIILLYSIIGKILMGIIAYKIFLIRKE